MCPDCLPPEEAFLLMPFFREHLSVKPETVSVLIPDKFEPFLIL